MAFNSVAFLVSDSSRDRRGRWEPSRPVPASFGGRSSEGSGAVTNSSGDRPSVNGFGWLLTVPGDSLGGFGDMQTGRLGVWKHFPIQSLVVPSEVRTGALGFQTALTIFTSDIHGTGRVTYMKIPCSNDPNKGNPSSPIGLCGT